VQVHELVALLSSGECVCTGAYQCMYVCALVGLYIKGQFTPMPHNTRACLQFSDNEQFPLPLPQVFTAPQTLHCCTMELHIISDSLA